MIRTKTRTDETLQKEARRIAEEKIGQTDLTL
jgi:ADP-ribose pyrophosphatase YjhB (NUDIX family)